MPRLCDASLMLSGLISDMWMISTQAKHTFTFNNLSFFSIGYPCPVNYNPADYFVHILAFIPEKEEESRERVKVWYSPFVKL